MSEKSQISERALSAKNEHDVIPARPVELIREADLDKVGGGGGAAGGVVYRQHA